MKHLWQQAQRTGFNMILPARLLDPFKARGVKPAAQGREVVTGKPCEV